MRIGIYNVTTANKTGGIETFCWEVANELNRQKVYAEIITGIGEHVKYPELPIKMFSYISREKIPNLGNRFKKFGERLSFFLLGGRKHLANFDCLILLKPFDFFVASYVKRLNPNIITFFISGGEDFYFFDRRFSSKVDIMAAVSNANAEIISSRYKRKVHVVYNGVNINQFRFNLKHRELLRKKYNFNQKKVLLSVGRIVGWKGYQLVIKALPKLNEYVYVLIGKGPYLSELQKLCQDVGVSEQVFFLGEREHKDLPAFYSMADIFVQPSIGHEAFGITVVEAMSCGIPVVGSNNGGIREIIRDGYNGYLFRPKDVNDLVAKIEMAEKNWENLSKNCVKHVSENFTWSKTAQKIIELIRGHMRYGN
ncbi:glycosyltransferase family 4 protein [Thermodesulfatator atlanticus]|uniref:glycosyltransferase family 4 protein n=1 Tax=Thermodesulfatator atlanticus TaxID=501497 RepID=UPI0003B3EEC0|nr:glycosyltransferase family 4 protein [Thermodesulfatator atlanticus]